MSIGRLVDEEGALTGEGGYLDADLARILETAPDALGWNHRAEPGRGRDIQDPDWPVDLAILDATVQYEWPHPIEGIEGVVSVTDEETVCALAPDGRDGSGSRAIQPWPPRLSRCSAMTVSEERSVAGSPWAGWLAFEEVTQVNWNDGTVTNGGVQYLEDGGDWECEFDLRWSCR